MPRISFTLIVISILAIKSGCGNKIVNGTDAADGEFPFVVSLQRAPTGQHSCGASIITPSWVLTAAHCVSSTRAELRKIQYGSNVLDSNSKNVVNVSKIFVHERYAPKNRYENDIALLKLAKPIKFNDKAQAVRLPKFKQQTRENSAAILIGWGLNATGGSVQKHLQKVDLQTLSDEECSRRFEMPIHETNICAGVPEGGKGQCNGDSGGPLIVNGTQVGIVSWSLKPCTIAPYPGVYTEVAYYINWIAKTMDREAQSENGFNIFETILGGLFPTSTRRSKMPLDIEQFNFVRNI